MNLCGQMLMLLSKSLQQIKDFVTKATVSVPVPDPFQGFIICTLFTFVDEIYQLGTYLFSVCGGM